MSEEGTKRKEVKVKYLPVKLTDEELMEKAKAAASLMMEVSKDQNELASISERFKDSKKSLTEDIESNIRKASALSSIVDSGEERRDVDCEVLFDYDAGTVTVTRKDTDEVIETRNMTDDESQELPMNSEDDTEEEESNEDTELGPEDLDQDDYPEEDDSSFFDEEEDLGD